MIFLIKPLFKNLCNIFAFILVLSDNLWNLRTTFDILEFSILWNTCLLRHHSCLIFLLIASLFFFFFSFHIFLAGSFLFPQLLNVEVSLSLSFGLVFFPICNTLPRWSYLFNGFKYHLYPNNSQICISKLNFSLKFHVYNYDILETSI